MSCLEFGSYGFSFVLLNWYEKPSEKVVLPDGALLFINWTGFKLNACDLFFYKLCVTPFFLGMVLKLYCTLKGGNSHLT